MPKSFYIVLSLIHQSNPRIIDRPWFESLETATKIYLHSHHISYSLQKSFRIFSQPVMEKMDGQKKQTIFST